MSKATRTDGDDHDSTSMATGKDSAGDTHGGSVEDLLTKQDIKALKTTMNVEGVVNCPKVWMSMCLCYGVIFFFVLIDL